MRGLDNCAVTANYVQSPIISASNRWASILLAFEKKAGPYKQPSTPLEVEPSWCVGLS
jgi:hypothetical protein